MPQTSTTKPKALASGMPNLHGAPKAEVANVHPRIESLATWCVVAIHPRLTPTARRIRFVVLLLALFSVPAYAQVVDFEDWTLDAESFYIGPVDEELGVEQPGPFGGIDRIGYVQSGNISFVNRFNLRFGNWSGFAISNRTDRTTPGIASQTSAFPGIGAEGSNNYAVGFGYVDNLNPMDMELLETLPHFDIPAGKQIEQLEVTNSTYAALSMQNGDAFAKKFGGDSGNDPDFFRLTVHGLRSDGQLIDETVSLFLADYRFDDNARDTILETWQTLDLTPLSSASRLYFNLDSTNSNMAGMVTPAYFAIDNIVLRGVLSTDINNDGELTTIDANALCGAISTSNYTPSFDFNSDGELTLEDLSPLLLEANSLNGDADFNSAVQFADFLTLSQQFGSAGNWSEGDFNCDGAVGFPDFLILSSNFGQEALALHNIPELHGMALLAIAWLCLLGKRPSSRRYRSIL